MLIGLELFGLLGGHDGVGIRALGLRGGEQTFLHIIERRIGGQIFSVDVAFGGDVRPVGIFVSALAGEHAIQRGGGVDARAGEKFVRVFVQIQPIAQGGEDGRVVIGRFTG